MTEANRSEAFADLAIHPGEVLAEELEARAMTEKALALHRPPQVINKIIRGKKAITAETALELERVLGPSARFWMNLQTTYDLTRAYTARSTHAV